jgi:hypothetical protein
MEGRPALKNPPSSNALQRGSGVFSMFTPMAKQSKGLQAGQPKGERKEEKDEQKAGKTQTPKGELNPEEDEQKALQLRTGMRVYRAHSRLAFNLNVTNLDFSSC